MLFKLLYILFFVCSLLYGSWYIGPVTPRQLMAVVMLMYLIIKKKVVFDKYINIYLGFISFYLLSNILSGHSIDAIKFVVSFFMVACIGYWATLYLFEIRNGLKVLIYTIICIGLFNALVTTDQLLHYNIFTSIVDTLHLSDGFEVFSDKHTNYEDSTGNEFIYALPGILQDPVTNGYFSAIATISALTLPLVYNRIYNYIPWLLILIGCFATQQRTSFVGAILLSFVILYYITFNIDSNKKNKNTWYIPTILLVSSLFFLLNNSISMETRYDDLFDMSSRTNLADYSFEFIRNNFFFGGIFTFFEQYQVYPHNLLFNALIVGGFFGAILIFIILSFHIKSCISIFSKRKKDLLSLIPCFVIVSMLGNSLFHNQSIVYGDFVYWCFAAYLTKKATKKKKFILRLKRKSQSQ